jgi:hypothetical protein
MRALRSVRIQLYSTKAAWRAVGATGCSGSQGITGHMARQEPRKENHTPIAGNCFLCSVTSERTT